MDGTRVARLERQVMWLRLAVALCVAATCATAFVAYHALNPRQITIGKTILDERGLTVYADDRSAGVYAHGVWTGDRRAYAELTGSQLTMETKHGVTRPEVRLAVDLERATMALESRAATAKLEIVDEDATLDLHGETRVELPANR